MNDFFFWGGGAELEVQLASHRPGIKINMGWAGVRTLNFDFKKGCIFVRK